VARVDQSLVRSAEKKRSALQKCWVDYSPRNLRRPGNLAAESTAGLTDRGGGGPRPTQERLARARAAAPIDRAPAVP
jgi:hypothetical protein